jgi:glycosyltransferase involved in cell wall biosynthesis
LPEESILSDDFLRELMNVGEVDILVGVPTFNDARTVGQVVQAIRAGLLKYFPRQRAVIINADGGSKDETQELVRAASISDLQHVSNLQALRTLHCISTRYNGGPQSGNALHTILAAGDLLRASASAVISADSTNIEPEWMDRLLRPVTRDNYDLITPLYRRHKFDGLLVRNLVYPMSRAIYARQIREPYPSELAFSGRLSSQFLNSDSPQDGEVGSEFNLLVAAISGGFRIAQSFLGERARVDQPPSDLVQAMRQTVGPLFGSLERNFVYWSNDGQPQPVAAIGAEPDLNLEPLRINRKRLFQMFTHGVAELRPVFEVILSPATHAELQRASGKSEEQFCYRNELWVRTVYEFAASHHKEVINRDHIIQALAPLYRGRAYTFLVENRDASSEQVEQNVEGLCRTFERLKPYLLELWNSK